MFARCLDQTRASIIIYGSEVWGFENLKQIEAVHTQYCKYNYIEIKKKYYELHDTGGTW